jgi:hypothetical protein
MDFSPGFLYDQNPELIEIGLGKERLVAVVQRNVIVNDDLLDVTIDPHLNFVNSVSVELTLISKDPFNSKLFFGHRCNSRQKVSIVEIALDDVSGIDTLNKKFGSLDKV